MNGKKSKLLWYDNSNIITNIIIGLIIVIVLSSQSFAVNNNLSVGYVLRDIINHNMHYTFILIYFVALKFDFGKKYFNHFNVFLVILYVILSFTGILSIFQSISFAGLLSLAIKIVLLVFLIHSMFKDTHYYKEFKINKSPFNEISNEEYFSILMVLSCILLAFNLIFSNNLDGAIISVLDACYVMFFARYIYLYNDYLELKEIIKLKNVKEVKEEN